jgi:alanyl-tRNA synthetase
VYKRQKVTDDELFRIESIVNKRIRENIEKMEQRNIPIEQAQEAGAMMLFGEKYGERVRMITFDPGWSVELCGGCHVPSTGRIGLFKIVHETSVAAGVRRIEAVTARAAELYVHDRLLEFQQVQELVKNPAGVGQAVASLIEENKRLRKELDQARADQAGNLKADLIRNARAVGDAQVIAKRLEIDDAKALKTLSYEIENAMGGNAFVLFGFVSNGKPQLMLTIGKDLVARGLNAGAIIRELAREIGGGGGGQPFFATAGGKDPEGLDQAILRAEAFIPLDS